MLWLTELAWGLSSPWTQPSWTAGSADPPRHLSMRIQSGSGLLAGVGGRGTVNLGKLQVFRVLNFIRFECVIVKVKSGEMTALSKSNVEKIRTVRETREKQALGTNPPKTCRQAGDFYVPSRLCLLKNKSLPCHFI